MQEEVAASVGDENVRRTLFCKGLPQEVTKGILYELFLFAGPIQSIRLPRARPSGTTAAKQKPVESSSDAGSNAKKKKRKKKKKKKNGEGESVDASVTAVDSAPDGGQRAVEEFLVAKSEDGARRLGGVGDAVLADDGEGGSREAPVVASDVAERKCRDLANNAQNSTNSEKKPYSIEDKILFRYRVGEHQGFAFIVYWHVQSVDYAMNIFEGTKLFGSEISMSPAQQLKNKTMKDSKFPEKGSNTAKSKTEMCQRQDNRANQRQSEIPGVGRWRDIANRCLKLKRDQVAFDRYNNNALRNGVIKAQTIPPGNDDFLVTTVYVSGNRQNSPRVVNDPRTVQGNWRVRSDGNNRDFVADPEAVPGTYDIDQWQYWSDRHAAHDEWARNSYGNVAPRLQTPSYRGSQRKTVLHATIPRLGRGRLRTGNPIIESSSFLPLTPNLAQHGCDPPREPPLMVAPVYECSPIVYPPFTPFPLDKPRSTSPSTSNGDEHIPILYYEMDTKPGVETFSNNIYDADGQTGTENWDLPSPTHDNVRLMASLTLNGIESTPEQHWNASGTEQFAYRLSSHDGLSAPQLHYQHYDVDGFSSCEPIAFSDSRAKYDEMQYVDPLRLGNPYVQTPSQMYGMECGQWRPELPHMAVQGHVPNGQQVEQLSESSQQIIDQFRLVNLGYGNSMIGRPASYTRVFGQGVDRQPATTAYLEDPALECPDTRFSGAERQNDPASHAEQNTKEFLHRSRSCHVAPTKRDLVSRARATHSSGNMEELPADGQWVSPAVWKLKGAWLNANQCRGGQRKPEPAHQRSSRHSGPPLPRDKPPSGGPKRPAERRYTLSECLDTAFEAYRQGNAGNSPSSKQAGV